jgi:RHS repeat-associated protein
MADGNGLYFMRARFYSPDIKRFVNMDVLVGSVGVGQSLNRFAYVRGDPVKYTDPFGLDRSCGPGYRAVIDPNQPQVSYCIKDGSDPYKAICVSAECGMYGVPLVDTGIQLRQTYSGVLYCCRPAEILWGLVNHCWIKTASIEAGMGTARDGIAGQNYDYPYITRVEIVEHSATKGYFPTSCQVVPKVDEHCVNDKLIIGQPLGRFWLLNNCQIFANGVLSQCDL